MPQEKQTTAMQDLITMLSECIDVCESRNRKEVYITIKQQAEYLLKIERQQIEYAYKQGNFDGIVMKDANSNEYFNRTFTQQQ